MKRLVISAAAACAFTFSAGCGSEAPTGGHPCGRGTEWNGTECVVKAGAPTPSAPSTSEPKIGTVDLGLQGLAPGPCAIETRVAPVDDATKPENFKANGTKNTFTYAPSGQLKTQILEYRDANSASGFTQEPTTFGYDGMGRIATIEREGFYGDVNSTFAYDARGLALSQSIQVVKKFATTEESWTFGYDGAGALTQWVLKESDSPAKTTNVQADGPRKQKVDCASNVGGETTAGTCFYEYDEKGRLTRYVYSHASLPTTERGYRYEGEFLVEFYIDVDGERDSTFSLVRDRYGNLSHRDWQTKRGTTVEREVYDYACWVGKELPKPAEACGKGGRPEFAARGTCFERLSGVTQIY